MAVTTTIDLIRHGEPVGGKKYRGQIDDPLSGKGWKQMRAAVGDACPWNRIISSSLSRCADFAQELAQRHQLPLELDSRLTEIGFGVWEGKTAEEIMAEDPQALINFWQDPAGYRPEGAEALPDFAQRVIAGFDQAVAQYPGQHLLMVGHAGMMRMILRHVLDMPLEAMFKIEVPNAGISRIKIDHHDQGTLMRLCFHAGKLC
ncbi:MAG: alpha-ribazole phosphatase family protein [Gammaproteobacteria bacterium]|nr:alpha-ribazole phosphatase family protein [Gammaproteobacteria bacterium]